MKYSALQQSRILCIDIVLLTCSRDQGLCKVYGVEIIISDEVYQMVSSEFLCRPLDRVAVKGRVSSTELYELMVSRTHASPAQLTLVALFEQMGIFGMVYQCLFLLNCSKTEYIVIFWW